MSVLRGLLPIKENMKIVAINGSYRGQRGQTSGFLDLLKTGAEIGGAQFEVIHLAEIKMNHCLGCDRCHQPVQHLRCVFTEKDDVAGIFERMASADCLVYATPVYVFGISSLLKTFLDRLYGTSDVNQLKVTQSGLFFHHVDGQICSKPFISLICCDNLDPLMPSNARDYFRIYARFMDAPLQGELIRDGARLFGDVRQRDQSPIMPKTAAVYQAFQQAGFELATEGRIAKRTLRHVSQAIIPVPMFDYLRRVRLFKHAMVFHASDMLPKVGAK